MAPPGDSRPSHFHIPMLREDEARAGPLEPMSHARASAVILNMDDFTKEEDYQAAARYWKSVADRLKAANFPIFATPETTATFPAETQELATQLANFCTELLGTANDGILEQSSTYYRLLALFAQGDDTKVFKEKMRFYNYLERCNSIWENESVAYRCNTCAKTPCMSLCADCFLDGDKHAGHDFTRFTSREGGACDCGNADVLNEEGFCPHHGPNAERPPPAPRDIVSLPEFMIPRLFLRFFVMSRGMMSDLKNKVGTNPELSGMEQLLYMADVRTKKVAKLVEFLQECVKIGGPLREIISAMLIDETVYAEMKREIKGPGELSLWESADLLGEDVEGLCDIAPMKQHFDLWGDMLVFDCMLDELLFWIARLTFPQQLINLSLGLFSHHEYAHRYAVRFFKLYPAVVDIVRRLSEALHAFSMMNREKYSVNQIGCRIIHVSVQMLSSEQTCLALDTEMGLLQMIFDSLQYLFKDMLHDSDMTLAPLFRHMTNQDEVAQAIHTTWPLVRCKGNRILHANGYWFVMGDLHNLLSHPHVVERIFSQCDTLGAGYLSSLRWLQGINHTYRIIGGEHQPWDDTFVMNHGFTLEYELSATCMYNSVQGLFELRQGDVARRFVETFRGVLEEWFEALICPRTPPMSCHPFSVSFHLPLHRHLSCALTQLKHLPGMGFHDNPLADDVDFLKKLVLHPMRIQAIRTEYQNNMWVRNGNFIRLSLALYTQQHISMSMLLPDVDILRFCASKLPTDWFWDAVLESFHLQDVFAWAGRPRRPESQDDDAQALVTEITGFKITKKFRMKVRSETDGGPLSPTAEGSPAMAGDSTESQDSRAEPGAKVAKMEGTSGSPGIQTPLLSPSQEAGPSSPRPAPSSSSTTPEQGDGKVRRGSLSGRSSPPPPVIHEICWKGQKSDVVTREDWIPPLVSGALRTIAQCIVMKGNWEPDSRKVIHNELIYELCISDHTRSRLKACVSDKGSRGIPDGESLFEQQLAKVADFVQPTSTTQGMYRLKDEAWLTDFCPIPLQVRAMTNRVWAEVLNRVQERDRARLAADDPRKKATTPLWVPYRLINFHSNNPMEMALGGLVECERFFEMSVIVLRAVAQTHLVHENSLQLVVYLLSLSLKFAQVIPDERREKLVSHFTKIYRVHDIDGFRETHLLGTLLRFCNDAATKAPSAEFVRVLQNELTHEPVDRIIGGQFEYIARVCNLLALVSPAARTILDKLYKNTQQQPDSPAESTESSERRAAAKRRMEQFLARNKQQNQETMKKIMEAEGVTQDEVDEMDTSGEQVKLYDCPICGDSTPNTLESPVGMMCRLTPNFIVGAMVDVDAPPATLLEMHNKYGEQGLSVDRKSRKAWDQRRAALYTKGCEQVGAEPIQPGQSRVDLHRYQYQIEADCEHELKTCGHTAHIACIDHYTATLNFQDLGLEHQYPFEMNCPSCRAQMNCVLPLKLDLADEAPIHRQTEMTPDVIKEKVLRSVTECQRCFESQDIQRLFNAHYGGNLHGIYDRQRSDHLSLHNYLVALIKGNVERNLVRAQLNMKPKTSRTSIAENLIPALAHHSPLADRNMTLLATRDLFEIEPPPQTFVSQQVRFYDRIMHVDEQMEMMRPSKPPEEIDMDEVLYRTSDVPLLIAEPKALLVRLTAFIIANPELSPPEKNALCQAVAKRCHDVALLRASVQLHLRSNERDLRETATADYGPLRYHFVVADALVNTPLIAEKAIQPCDRMPDFSTVLPEVSAHFLRFITQLWLEIGMAEGTLEELCSKIAISADMRYSDDVIRRFVKAAAPAYVMQQGCGFPLSREPILYRPWTILELPDNYEDIFEKFYRRKCVHCGECPANPFICLLCSQICCITSCCDQTHGQVAQNEVERHALDAEHGLSIFLAMSTCWVFIVRKRRYLSWGGLYLDKYGEEDKWMRRGKPLFLSKERMKALQNDWVEMSFHDQERRGWHQFEELIQDIESRNMH